MKSWHYLGVCSEFQQYKISDLRTNLRLTIMEGADRVRGRGEKRGRRGGGRREKRGREEGGEGEGGGRRGGVRKERGGRKGDEGAGGGGKGREGPTPPVHPLIMKHIPLNGS